MDNVVKAANFEAAYFAAFAKADAKAATATVKNGFRNGNTINGAGRTLRAELEAAGFDNRTACKMATDWVYNARKAGG